MITASLRNQTPFPARVEFLSDWACGTGTGRHSAIDRSVERDADGLPVLPGKTLAAMMRDAAETVAAGLDEGTIGLWHDWVEAIFGTEQRLGEHGLSSFRQPDLPGPASSRRRRPQPAALRSRPLRLAQPVRAAIMAMPQPRRRLATDATVLLRPGVAIDEKTGAAADEKFRIEERAAAGVTVQAQWQICFPGVTSGEPIPWEAELLLRAAARMVDAVGGRRRRGAGRCRVSIGDQDRLEVLLDHIDAARPPHVALPMAAASVPVVASQIGEPAIQPPRHRYDLRITALTPLLAHRGEVGNTVLSDSYVPGASLLPMVSAALGPAATALVTGGRVVVTNATPEWEGHRSLPTPRALQQEKGGQSSTLVNVLRLDRMERPRRLMPRSGFCVPVDGGVHVGEVTLVSHAHAVVDDAPQRPTERTGGLFVYEAMAAGTVLRAEVWLPDGVAFDRDAVSGERALGRSKKDDYGQVYVEVLDATLQPPPTPPSDGELVVWLTSELLMSGEAGEPSTDLSRLATILGDALGVSLAVPEAVPDQPPVALVTTRRIESWHSRWGLPRPSLVGLAAGGVVRFTMHGQPTAEAYHRVMACGVGERTAEGFGRVVLQPDLLQPDLLPQHSAEAVPPVAASAEVSGESLPPFVTDLEVRGWRREVRRMAMARARDPQLRRQLVPPTATAAQMGTLRTLAEGVTTDAGLDAARNWLSGVRERRRDIWAGDDDQRLDRLDRIFSAAGGKELWRWYGITPPSHVADQLYRPALAALLSEVARTQRLAGETADSQEDTE